MIIGVINLRSPFKVHYFKWGKFFFWNFAMFLACIIIKNNLIFLCSIIVKQKNTNCTHIYYFDDFCYINIF